MGVAVLSGVLASLDTKVTQPPTKWESHTPGTLTPLGPPSADESLPSRFIACVSKEESVKRIQEIFNLGYLGPSIEVSAGQNVKAVQEADVILLCCKPQLAESILSEPGLKEALERKLLISILAGVTITQLTAMVAPSTKVIRAMPNTPCKVCTRGPPKDSVGHPSEPDRFLNV